MGWYPSGVTRTRIIRVIGVNFSEFLIGRNRDNEIQFDLSEFELSGFYDGMYIQRILRKLHQWTRSVSVSFIHNILTVLISRWIVKDYTCRINATRTEAANILRMYSGQDALKIQKILKWQQPRAPIDWHGPYQARVNHRIMCHIQYYWGKSLRRSRLLALDLAHLKGDGCTRPHTG